MSPVETLGANQVGIDSGLFRETLSLHSVHLCTESGVILLSAEFFSFQHVFKGGARPLSAYIISVFLSVCHSGMMKSLECLGDI